MTHIQYTTPLTFPPGRDRTPATGIAYNTTFSENITIEEAVRYLHDEMDSLNAQSVTLHTNYERLTSKAERKKRGHSEGAAVTMTVLSRECHLACDKWHSVAHNIYALHLAVRHIRLFEEWGVCNAGQMIVGLNYYNMSRVKEEAQRERMESSGANSTAEWMNMLGLGETATLEDANAMYRAKAKRVASDPSALLELNNAIEQARKELGA